MSKFYRRRPSAAGSNVLRDVVYAVEAHFIFSSLRITIGNNKDILNGGLLKVSVFSNLFSDAARFPAFFEPITGENPHQL
jgi:hypothetical protein